MRDALLKRGYETVSFGTHRERDIGYFVYSAVEAAFTLPKGYDIYHCLSPIEAIYAPKASSIVTFHDLIPWLHLNKTETHYAQGPMKQVKRLISKHYFKAAASMASKCSLIACNSEHTRQELIEHLNVDETKVSVIRFGISQTLDPGPKKDKIFRIGTLSYLDPRKRIDILIQAFLAAGIDGELVIGGTGADYHRLAELARQHDERIKFVGFVPEEKLAEFYNSLDLFVFPTKVEGYGLPIVEAFACKKPVIVLHDAIMPDEIKSRCVVVDNLTEFLKNQKLTLDIERNYDFAKIHDWNSCVEDYTKLYQRVLERK
jgi:glycosyltransferase involved in cell wall biosynthesis